MEIKEIKLSKKKNTEDFVRSYFPNFIVKLISKLHLKTLHKKMKFYFKYGTTDFFDGVGFEVTTVCNRRCSYCQNSVYDRGLPKNSKIMDFELFKKVIDELVLIDYAGPIGTTSYCEPLVFKDIHIKCTKYIKEKLPKSEVILISNGDYLTIDVYNEFVDAGVDSLILTVHEGFKSPNIPNLKKYLEENGDNRIKVVFKEIDQDKQALSNRGGVVKPKIVNYSPPCIYSSPINISWDGYLNMCCNEYLFKYTFGNVKDKTLLEIWNSEGYKRFRKDVRNRDFKLPICKKCVGIDK